MSALVDLFGENLPEEQLKKILSCMFLNDDEMFLTAAIFWLKSQQPIRRREEPKKLFSLNREIGKLVLKNI
jgi:hypothetical protein